MDYLQDLRNADTIERLRPYFDMIAKGHEGMWDSINILVQDPTGEGAKYMAAVDNLRTAHARVLDIQKEIANRLVLVGCEAEVAADKLIGDALGLPADRRIARGDFEDDCN